MAESPQIIVNDEIRRQVLLEGVKKSEAKKFTKHLKTLEKGIRVRLSEEGQTIRNRTRLNALLSDVRKIEKDVFREYLDEANAGFDEVVLTEANLEASVLSKSIEDFEAVLPAPQQLLTAFNKNALSLRGKSQGLSLKPFLAQYETDQTALIEGIISQGFAEGKTIGQITQSLRGTRAANFKDGVYSNVNRNTEIMVRTAIQNASSQAKQATWNANQDVIVGVEWVSTLDSRTTSQCRSLDGEVFPVDEGPRPPIHFGCRSTTAPVLSEEFDFLKQGSKRPAKGQTAAGKTDIDQVRADTTYYSWLKGEPDQFQDKVLGGTRGELLRKGGLSSEQFAALQLNSNFQPLTLGEMAKEAKAAFEKANLLDDQGNVIKIKRNVQPS
jgi:SPP1 gp7 family putative phage head morphogenesis protein